MAVAIEWQDGTVIEGPTSASILDALASDPWNDCTPQEMLGKLSDRVWTIGRHAVDPSQDLDQFFHALERTGVIEILEWAPELGGAASTRAATTRRLSARQRRARG